jgi:hypothetical protein
MQYTIPNFGQYGYVETKIGFNWKAFLWFIVVVCIIGVVIYLFSKKEEADKDKQIASPNNTNPYALS